MSCSLAKRIGKVSETSVWSMTVRWETIEPIKGVAKGESSGVSNQQGGPMESRKGSGRPSSARPAPHSKGKYAALFPASKTQLRPQSARALKGKLKAGEPTPAMLLRVQQPPATVGEVKSNIVRIASAEEDGQGMDEEGLGTFLTQARSIESCRVSSHRSDFIRRSAQIRIR